MNQVDDMLEHHGVKGMHWGIINKKPPSLFRLQTNSMEVDSSIASSTAKDAKKVASLIGQRYGFKISAIKDLKINNPAEYAHGTVAFVQHTPGQAGGVIYMKPEDIRKDLKSAEASKWFSPGTGNVNAMLTHESAHAMFHAETKTKSGFLRVKVVGGNIEARDAALKASIKQAKKDNTPFLKDLSKISGYAAYSGTREEAEAEMFSQYHWSPNPPPFIQVWGKTLHQNLGVDDTPFRKLAKNG